MYQIATEHCGKYEVLTLHNSEQKHTLKIVPHKGACVYDLILHGRCVYDGYPNFEELDKLKWSRGVLLTPFPNRTEAGKYTFAGKSYQFPINNEATGTAIHGFLREMSFTVKNTETAKNFASVTCTTEYAGDRAYYPFPFRATVVYTLHDERGLDFHLSVENSGDSALPAGLGWHPYFSISDTVNDCELSLPPLQMVEIDENMIPTGNLLPFHFFDKRSPIEDFVSDNCFLLNTDEPVAEVRLHSAHGTLTYRQNTDYPYLQIFTPPHRQSIAFEPMTCNVNALNNGDGLQILQPGEQTELKCSVNFAPVRNL